MQQTQTLEQLGLFASLTAQTGPQDPAASKEAHQVEEDSKA